MDVQSPISPWIIGALLSLLCGSVLDGVGLLPVDWGRAESETFYVTINLWRVCLWLRNVTEAQGMSQKALKCNFPTQTHAEWVPQWIAVEVLAASCTSAIVVAIFVFVLSVKNHWLRSRLILTVIIPLAILSALFNFIGCLLIGTNLSSFKMAAGYPLVLNALAVVFFIAGALLSVLDIQGIGVKIGPLIGKGLRRHI